MTLHPSLRARRGSSSAPHPARLLLPGCHVRTRTSARGSESRPRSSPTTSLRAVTGPRSSFPPHRPRLPKKRDPQACWSYSLLYSRNESGGETRIGPLANREVFVTESELGRAALSLASFFVAKHFTPSPLQSHPPQWTLPRPVCAMLSGTEPAAAGRGHTVPIGTVYLSCCMGKSLTWGSHSSGTRRPLNAN